MLIIQLSARRYGILVQRRRHDVLRAARLPLGWHLRHHGVVRSFCLSSYSAPQSSCALSRTRRASLVSRLRLVGQLCRFREEYPQLEAGALHLRLRGTSRGLDLFCSVFCSFNLSSCHWYSIQPLDSFHGVHDSSPDTLDFATLCSEETARLTNTRYSQRPLPLQFGLGYE